MHVVLVGPELEENLSLRYLAASLRQAGHTASLARFNAREHLGSVVQQVRDQKAGLVGMSMVFQWRAREYFELARSLRRAGYEGHITAGGHFATFAREPILVDVPELDSIIRHEGEETICDLAGALESGAAPEVIAAIPGMTTRGESGAVIDAPPRRPVDGLDSLPFPARDTAPERHLGVPTAYLVGSRGCYAACDYCCISAWHRAGGGKRYRVRSVGNIADEMAELYRERGVRNFIFHDDNFFLPTTEANRERLGALRAEVGWRGLKGIGVMLKLRPNDCDRENLMILREIGLHRVFIGIENASQRQLRSLGRRATAGQLGACLDLLAELGIYCTFNLILFDPHTTLDDVGENLQFLRGHSSHPFNWCKVEVYAGTALESRYRAEGRLRGSYLGRGYDIEDPRAQLMYDLLLPAVYDRNFGYDGIANRNIGLGYNRQLLKHFHTGRLTRELSADTQRIIEAINGNTIELLERAHAFAGTADREDRAAIDRFGRELRHDSARAQEQLGEEVERVLCRIDRAAGLRPQPHLRAPTVATWPAERRFARRGLIAAAAGGLLWFLTGCGRKKRKEPPPHVSEMAPPPVDDDRAGEPPPAVPEMAPAPADPDRGEGEAGPGAGE